MSDIIGTPDAGLDLTAPAVTTTTPVTPEALNPYIQQFLNNDAALDLHMTQLDRALTDMERRVDLLEHPPMGEITATLHAAPGDTGLTLANNWSFVPRFSTSSGTITWATLDFGDGGTPMLVTDGMSVSHMYEVGSGEMTYTAVLTVHQSNGPDKVVTQQVVIVPIAHPPLPKPSLDITQLRPGTSEFIFGGGYAEGQISQRITRLFLEYGDGGSVTFDNQRSFQNHLYTYSQLGGLAPARLTATDEYGQTAVAEEAEVVSAPAPAPATIDSTVITTVRSTRYKDDAETSLGGRVTETTSLPARLLLDTFNHDADGAVAFQARSFDAAKTYRIALQINTTRNAAATLGLEFRYGGQGKPVIPPTVSDAGNDSDISWPGYQGSTKTFPGGRTTLSWDVSGNDLKTSDGWMMLVRPYASLPDLSLDTTVESIGITAL